MTRQATPRCPVTIEQEQRMVREAPKYGFPVSEFEGRLERAQRAMAAAGFDGLLLTTEPELRYFSGFRTLFWQSPTRPWFLYVPRAGKPVAVIPEIGAALMRNIIGR